jgi:putative protease
VHASGEEDEPIQRIDFDAMAAIREPAGEASVGQQQRHPLADRTYYIEEKERPGELMPISEDEHGTYIMNSKDLRAVQHVARLVSIGVDSLKVEGRTKTYYYAARTAQVYRRAIDDAVVGKPFDERLLMELEGLANRGYTDGFYQRHHTQEYQNYLRGVSDSERQRFVAEILDYDSHRGALEVLAKNKFAVGDRLQLILPKGNRTFTLERVESRSGESLTEVPGGGHQVYIPIAADDYRRGLLAKYL